MSTKHTINFKGITYQLDENYWKGSMINDSIDFQLMQLQYCLDIQDYNTLTNRLLNMTTWGGAYIKEK